MVTTAGSPTYGPPTGTHTTDDGGDGGAGTVTVTAATAWGPPLRLIVRPVNTRDVEVPPELVSVTVAVNVPAAA